MSDERVEASVMHEPRFGADPEVVHVGTRQAMEQYVKEHRHTFPGRLSIVVGDARRDAVERS